MVLSAPGCPNVPVLERRLAEALAGRPAVAVRRMIADAGEAARCGMRGSPTLLVNGHDPFAVPEMVPALACRMYEGEGGQQQPGQPGLGPFGERAEVHRFGAGLDLPRWPAALGVGAAPQPGQALSGDHLGDPGPVQRGAFGGQRCGDLVDGMPGGAQYSPQVLAGLSPAQIAAQLHNPSSPVAKAIDGSASVIIAAIDHILHISTPAGR